MISLKLLQFPDVAFAPKTMRNTFSFVFFLILCNLTTYVGHAQEPSRHPAPPVLAPVPQTAPQTVLDVRIEGNSQNSKADVLKVIKTKPGRPFNETLLEEDKRALIQKTWFFDVVTKVDKTPDGYIVTFQCIERPLIRGIKIGGNKAKTKKVLLEEANIKEGDALDPIAIHQAAERMAQFYRESGYHQVHIEVVEGDQTGDRGVIFQISEGPKQRVLEVVFEGNQIASGAYLKTLIHSKPGVFLWINSNFTLKQLDDDVETLTNYYRKLGFFYAKVDRVFVETAGYTGWGQPRNWVKVKFIIDEGPRCKIRDIRFVGNNVFDQATLLKTMKLAKGQKQYYSQDALEVDMHAIKEIYGNEGYIWAMPAPDPRVDQDYVDLVITVREGPRCYLETLDVEINGREDAESYTKWQPVLNLSSLRPGTLLRTSDINATKRRLMASNLFNRNPMQGTMPDFIFDYPKEALEEEAVAAEREAEAIASGNPQIRGQAPQKQGFSFQNIFPVKRAEPTLQLSPQSPIPLQTAPLNGTYRGQAPVPASNYYSPPVYTPPTYPAVPAQIYNPPVNPTNYENPANYGSVAQAPVPLQTSNPVTAPSLTVPGMYPMQYRMPETYTAAPETATILGNPYASLHDNSNIRFDPNAPPGASPYIYPVRGRIVLQEAQTGSIMVSLAVNSDAGLMGRLIYDELNFDILNFPKGWRFSDWRNAFRGKGQRLRIEAIPGTQLQRYSASWETPFWLDLDYSLGVNGSYYQRYYNEWYENRAGGSLTFGKLWTKDISTRLSLGGQRVEIFRAMPHIYDEGVVGKHPMYNIGLTAIYNTRDSEYIPTEGHFISSGIEQVLGDYQFLRGSVDVRKYFMLRERPDRSGRWVLGVRSSVSVTEGGTPIFERYFGGGVANLRGFEFRGVSPRTDNGYVRGGRFEFYNSAEMVFPLTADDMIKGALFVDTGTVERSISKWEENYRVALGFGLRISIPMMGPAPIALDFAFPLSWGHGDRKEIFGFGFNMMR